MLPQILQISGQIDTPEHDLDFLLIEHPVGFGVGFDH
jgi:hypothetical protein